MPLGLELDSSTARYIVHDKLMRVYTHAVPGMFPRLSQRPAWQVKISADELALEREAGAQFDRNLGFLALAEGGVGARCDRISEDKPFRLVRLSPVSEKVYAADSALTKYDRPFVPLEPSDEVAGLIAQLGLKSSTKTVPFARHLLFTVYVYADRLIEDEAGTLALLAGLREKLGLKEIAYRPFAHAVACVLF